MANEELLSILTQGVEVWNKWREENPQTQVGFMQANLSGAELRGANLRSVGFLGANLSGADLSSANLEDASLFFTDLRDANLAETRLIAANLHKAKLNGANLKAADLEKANLFRANLSRANLSGANLAETYARGAYFTGADLTGADLTAADLQTATFSRATLVGADLNSANLWEADLRGADLTGAYLGNANLVRAKIDNARISRSSVYAVNVWDLQGEFAEQKELIITPKKASAITVDNIKVAQFVYLILNNKEVRDVINTLTSKTVLILGRFVPEERKKILDGLREKLREYDLLPIVFDFDRPIDKDFTETVKTLAGLCYFVIADVTNPKSSPLELQATVPDYQIPFVPIIQEGEQPFAMMVDLQKKYTWVLPTRTYSSKEELIKKLKKGIIEPAMQKHNELRLIKAQEPDTVSLEDFDDES